MSTRTRSGRRLEALRRVGDWPSHVSPSSGPRRRSRSSRPVSGLVYPWGMPDNSGARLLDGASVARTLRERLRTQTQEIRRLGAPPFLRVIVVGEDPASMTYVSSKTRAAEEAGCLAETVRLPGTTAPQRLL